MIITIERKWFTDESTIGELRIDDGFQCYTLEDCVREVPNRAVATWKIDGKTAIPVGHYELVIDHSQRFGKDMPHILGVKGFEGIRIHKGNTDKDTEGCILVGWTRGENEVGESKKAFEALFPKIQDALKAEKVFVTVCGSKVVEEVPDLSGEISV